MDSVLGEAVPEGGPWWPRQRKAAAYARRCIHSTGKVEVLLGVRGGYETQSCYSLCDFWDTTTLSFTCFITGKG